MMIKIIHIITGLGGGGAENMLYKLLKYSDKNVYYHEVISLMDEGIMGEKIKAEGIIVHSLNLSGQNPINALTKARNLCQNFDMVNTWLYHADIFGFIVAKILLRKKLIWNVRHSNLEKKVNKSRTLKIVKINALLSKKVDCITYNSKKAIETHEKFGYSVMNSAFIPNGFELEALKADKNKRETIRKELLIKNEDKVLITVGRWDIQKDYYTLLQALNELKKKNVDFKMMLVGSDLDAANKELVALMNLYHLEENLYLLGRQGNVSDFLSAADVYVSSSLSESFSNSIGEAMACGLPCVVTDVGDSKLIVGETGLVVPAQDYIALSETMVKILNKTGLVKIGEEARSRISKYYNIEKIYQENFLDGKY